MSCTVPPSVENGYVSYESVRNGTLWADKDEVIYKCFKYYGLVDSDKLTCNGTTWDGVVPKCEYHQKTEIVFWFVLVLLILLVLLLLALIIFLCCYFCRCCKRCSKDKSQDDNDVERGRSKRRDSVNNRKSGDRSPKMRKGDGKNEATNSCCTCCGSSNKLEKIERQESARSESPQRSRVQEKEEKTGSCCACCVSGPRKTKKETQKRRLTSPPKRRRSKSSQTDTDRGKEEDEEQKSACCACCYGLFKADKKPVLLHASQKRDEILKGSRSRSPKRKESDSKIKDDHAVGKRSCCDCCYGPKKTKETQDRITLSKRKDSFKRGCSKSPIGNNDVNKIQVDDEQTNRGCCDCCSYTKKNDKKHEHFATLKRKVSSKRSRSKTSKTGHGHKKEVDDDVETKGGCCTNCYSKKENKSYPKDSRPKNEDITKERNDIKRNGTNLTLTQQRVSKSKNPDDELVEDEIKHMQEEQLKKRQEQERILKKKLEEERELELLSRLKKEQTERKRQKTLKNERKKEMEKQETERERDIQRQQQKELALVEEDKRLLQGNKFFREPENEKKHEKRLERGERENERQQKRQERLERERQKQEEKQRELDEREKERERFRLQQQELAKQQAEQRRKERQKRETERMKRTTKDMEEHKRHGIEDRSPEKNVESENNYLEGESVFNGPQTKRKKKGGRPKREVRPRYLDFTSDKYRTDNPKIYRPYKPAKPADFWCPFVHGVRSINTSTH